MKQSDFNNILLQLLINIQASLQANRDFLLDVLTRMPESPSTDQWVAEMKQKIDTWDSTQTDYRDALLAGIRNAYDPNLGSIDDLLKGIQPDE